MTSVSTVEVRYVLGGDETVRLEIDGVDVTADARLARGIIHFDPERARGVVTLDPGTHTAVVKRVERRGFGEQHDVIDTFEWSFSVL